MSCAWCVFLTYGNDTFTTPNCPCQNKFCTAHRDPNTRCACACLQLRSGASSSNVYSQSTAGCCSALSSRLRLAILALTHPFDGVQVGQVHSSRVGEDDVKTLRSLKFQVRSASRRMR